jgi:hypothetical protein
MSELWISLIAGLVVGVGVGWASAWRMALKLERCGVGPAEWDACDPRDPAWRAYAVPARDAGGR